ncbi:MAG TPA: hypothetical protein VH684_24740 [Xanthobacteraceae bacterium]|jgi:hypothetical protein
MANPDWRAGRINRNQRLSSKRPIPGGITLEDFGRIQRYLEDIFLDIENGTGQTGLPQEIHMRLNESEKPWPLPVFVGWYEAAGVEGRRMRLNHPHPALWRFGDDVLSEVYAEAINFADEEGDRAFQYRDWNSEMGEKRAGERATDPKAGHLYQTCLAIVIDHETPRVVPPGTDEPATFRRAVGTLVLGFGRKPDDDVLSRAHQIMREWALETADKTDTRRGGLLEWLKNEFDLGGPLLRATPNALDNRWLHRR